MKYYNDTYSYIKCIHILYIFVYANKILKCHMSACKLFIDSKQCVQINITFYYMLCFTKADQVNILLSLSNSYSTFIISK